MRTAGATFGLGWRNGDKIVIGGDEFIIDSVYQKDGTTNDTLALTMSAGKIKAAPARVNCAGLEIVGGEFTDNNESRNSKVWLQNGIYLDGARARISGITASDSRTGDKRTQVYGIRAEGQAAVELSGGDFTNNVAGDIGGGAKAAIKR